MKVRVLATAPRILFLILCQFILFHQIPYFGDASRIDHADIHRKQQLWMEHNRFVVQTCRRTFLGTNLMDFLKDHISRTIIENLINLNQCLGLNKYMKGLVRFNP